MNENLPRRDAFLLLYHMAATNAGTSYRRRSPVHYIAGTGNVGFKGGTNGYPDIPTTDNGAIGNACLQVVGIDATAAGNIPIELRRGAFQLDIAAAQDDS